MADESVPPFDPKGCRYDQRTYAGRLRRFREMTDPRTLFVGDEELAKVIAALSLSALMMTFLPGAIVVSRCART